MNSYLNRNYFDTKLLNTFKIQMHLLWQYKKTTGLQLSYSLTSNLHVFVDPKP